MTYNIEIRNDYEIEEFPVERVINAIHYVLERHSIEDNAALTLVLTSDEHVHQLNNQYRGVDAPTDVLSFPADPIPEEAQEEGEGPYLGDLIVAYPYTVHQAQESGHHPDDEFVLIAVHGTLHLLGYDHDTVENQARMWDAQSDALRVAGVRLEVPLFTFDDGE